MRALDRLERRIRLLESGPQTAGIDFSRWRGQPVLYAEEVLGITTLTDEMKDVLNHLHIPPFKVLVPSGHDTGKCVEEGEFLALADGARIRAGDLVGRTFTLLSLDNDGAIVPVAARAEWNAIEPVWELVTETGRRIVRNAHHPLWVGEVRRGPGVKTRVLSVPGWTCMAGIRPGQHVAVALSLPAFGETPMPEEDLRLLAWMIGDGGMTQSSITFTQQDGPTLERFRHAAAKKGVGLVATNKPYLYRLVGGPLCRYPSQDKKRRPGGGRRFNPIGDLLKANGLSRKHSRQKFIPACIWGLPRSQQALFLSCLYSTDGWASLGKRNHPEVGYCSVSERLARDVQEMLLRFGVHARLRYRKKVNAWTVDFSGAADILRFAAEVGIEDKADALAAVCSKAQQSVKHRHGWRTMQAAPGTRWERVESVRQIGIRRTVAIEVPDRNTFLTQFWEHNTHGCAVAVSYWYDCHNPGAVFSMGPRHSSLKDTVWAEVRMQRLRARLPVPHDFIGPSAPEMRSAPDHWAKALTASKDASLTGRHLPSMLFVCEEATGIDPVWWTVIKTMFDPDLGHAWLCIFNPTDTTSAVYLEDMGIDARPDDPPWHRFRLSALEHPNIRAQLDGQAKPVKGAVSLAMVDEWVREWCDPLGPGEQPTATDIEWRPGSGSWWRPGAEFQSRALGLWPETGSGVWSELLWQAALRHRPVHFPLNELPRIGVDCAMGKGEDYFALHGRWGRTSLLHETSNTMDPARIFARIKDACARLAEVVNRERPAKAEPCNPKRILVQIDDDGTGNAVASFLSRDGYSVRRIGAATTAQSPSKYPSRRDELWFMAAEKARQGLVDLSRLDRATLRRLRQQLLAPRWELDSAGRREVEPKDDTKEKIGRSPDDADALNLAYSETGGSVGGEARKPARGDDRSNPLLGRR